MCAYLKGQSTGRCVRIYRDRVRQMCAYLEGQSKADVVCVFGGT